MKSSRVLTIFFVVLGILTLNLLGPVGVLAETCPSSIEGLPESELQRLLVVCENEIADRSAKLTNTQKQATTLESIIQQLKYRIQKSELEIKSRNIKIAQIGDDIVVQSNNILSLTGRIDRMKLSLSELIRKAEELTSNTPAEVVLSSKSLSDFFVNLDDYSVIQERLQGTIREIATVKSATEEEKRSLEGSKLKENELRLAQVEEKKRTDSLKREQERALAVTRDQEGAYKKEIAERERIKNDIRNRIFRTVGGQELRFEEALRLVRLYENRIGVNAALVLAVLTQESSVDGLIGKNIGKCTYNQQANNNSGTVMSDSQKPSYLALMSELGLNANTTPVSCPITADGQYGGAMGPSQFMPTTWWNIETETGYKRRVSQVMDIARPSPFNALDAFTGTALYLSDGLERCRTAFSSTFELRACTAAKYYSGLGSSGSRLLRHMNPTYSYGYQVATRAAQFEKDIALLDN